MLKNIEKCTDERLGAIYWLAKEGIKWAKNHPQLKEITRELKNRNLI